MKEYLKLLTNKQTKSDLSDDVVPIEEWASEFFPTSSLSTISYAGVVKASPNRAI